MSKAIILILPLVLLLILFLPQTGQAQPVNLGIILYWQANTYTAPEYPAKALPTANSFVQVTALVDSPIYSSFSLDFRWFLDDKLMLGFGGLAKNDFSFAVAEYKTNSFHQVKVQVFDPAYQNLLLEKEISIPVVAPELGLKTRITLPTNIALLSASQKTAQLTALPLFFNINKASELTYDWNINGLSASQNQTTDKPHILNLGFNESSVTDLIITAVSHKYSQEKAVYQKRLELK